MPIISSIPKRFNDGFKELSQLSNETFDLIQKGLLSTQLISSQEELAAKLSDSNNLDKNLIENIFLSVGALIPFLEDEEDIEEITDDVIQLILKNETIQEKEANVLKERLLFLIRERKIFYAAKAEDLISENAEIFITGKILTDFRPIFDLDVTKLPQAGVITHTLHIHYQSESAAPHKDLYLSLDTYDIQILVDILLRAEAKEETLKQLMKKTEINILDSE